MTEDHKCQPDTADATVCMGCGYGLGIHRLIIDGQTYHPSCAPSANYEIRALKSRVEELEAVARMAKAAAEMELGIAAAPDFSPRDMLYAACGALGLSLEGRGGAT